MQINENAPLVSIIVPCYNVEKYLPNCIESIIGQSYSNWELILVDDGSPDRSGEIADGYALQDKRIRVIHKHNGGLSSARNAGMRVMSGDYVTFVDSDDYLQHDALKIFIANAEKYNAQIVQCDYIRGSEKIFPQWQAKEVVNVYDNHTVFTHGASKIIVCGKLYKRELLNGILMPEGLINEDDWTTWKLYYRATNIVVTNRPLYYYTINPSSITGISKKRPDVTYYGAYSERISFFCRTGEKDLEDISRLQFCKSLLLSYPNEQLSDEQRKEIRILFNVHWQKLKKSAVVPMLFKVLFCGFRMSPMLVSKVVVKCHKTER